jgi:hypothetical protein
MFNPSQDDVRRFFCGTWRKHRAREVLTPLEDIAARWMVVHPEYHATLADEAAALDAIYSPDAGRSNPFLHLSMHMTISEQAQADQPSGIKAAYEALRAQMGDPHAAHHEIMECLGEMLWTAQRNKAPPDGAAYLACIRHRAGLPD